MPITTACPYCQTTYKLRDDLAGKWATCKQPNCRKPFQIPGGVAAPSVAAPVDAIANGAAIPTGRLASASPTGSSNQSPRNAPHRLDKPLAPISPEAEAEALRALSDDPPAPEALAAPTAPIKMVCAACDHNWTVDRSMEGKNALCPECKHRQKVPLQVVQKPKDWRDTSSDKPSLARRDQEKAPDGAWTNQRVQVSQKTLQDAGAIRVEDDREPTPIYLKLAKGLVALAMLMGAVVLVSFMAQSSSTYNAEVDLKKAFEAINQKEVEAEKHPLWLASVYAGAGSHALRLADSDADRKKAVESLHSAITMIANTPNSMERSLLLTDIVVTQAKLGGSKLEVEDEIRLPWDVVQVDLRRSFEKFRGADLDYRLEAFRRVTAALTERGQPLLATKFLSFVSTSDAESLECLSAMGLELLRLGQREAADEVMKLASPLATGDGKAKPAIASRAFQTFLMAFDGEGGKRAVLPPPGPAEPPMEVRIAYAHGWALQGKFDEARKLVERNGRPEARLRAALAVAEVAIDKQHAVAGPMLDLSMTLITKDLRTQLPMNLVWKLARLLARNQQATRALELADLPKDEADRLWVRYFIAIEQLASDPNQNGDWAWLEKLGTPKDLPNLWLREAIARRQAKNGVSSVEDTVKAWESPAAQAFGYVGICLGILDRKSPP